MAVKDFSTVEAYAKQHSEMLAMLENLAEFIATMPAPDEDGIIRGVDYGYTGDVGRIHGLLKDASGIAYEMGE